MKYVKRGLGYGRVSTKGQLEDDYGKRKNDASPEAQKTRCEHHLVNLSNTAGVKYELIEFLKDEGFSGKNTNRPAYQKMFDMTSKRQIDFIIAAELPRLSRSVQDLLDLVSHCKKNGVDLIILDLNLDTSTAIGKMMLVMLSAISEFERNVTSHRVKENAMARLLKDGKINGSSEILGLAKDPDRRGHFLRDEKGLATAEQILRLYLKHPSRKKVLELSIAAGLEGTMGKELTARMIDIILQNVPLRYRGVWRINPGNKDVDQDTLSGPEQYKLIPLPHGQLLNSKLLDDVEAKIVSQKINRKVSGSEEYIYLITSMLEYEDGSKFFGACAKNREYRYYVNNTQKLRIRCDEIHPVILRWVKNLVTNHEQFEKLVKDAILRRQSEIPKIDSHVSAKQKELKALGDSEEDLKKQLLDPVLRAKPEFFSWLDGQISEMTKKKELLLQEINSLERVKTEVQRKVGLDDIKATAKEFADRFKSLTGTEQRILIQKIIKKIRVHKDNRLEIVVNCTPVWGRSGVTTWRNKSTDQEENGGVNGTRTRGLPRDRRTL